eukprot:tig00000842_g4846.t1
MDGPSGWPPPVVRVRAADRTEQEKRERERKEDERGAQVAFAKALMQLDGALLASCPVCAKDLGRTMEKNRATHVRGCAKKANADLRVLAEKLVAASARLAERGLSSPSFLCREEAPGISHAEGDAGASPHITANQAGSDGRDGAAESLAARNRTLDIGRHVFRSGEAGQRLSKFQQGAPSSRKPITSPLGAVEDTAQQEALELETVSPAPDPASASRSVGPTEPPRLDTAEPQEHPGSSPGPGRDPPSPTPAAATAAAAAARRISSPMPSPMPGRNKKVQESDRLEECSLLGANRRQKRARPEPSGKARAKVTAASAEESKENCSHPPDAEQGAGRPQRRAAKRGRRQVPGLAGGTAGTAIDLDRRQAAAGAPWGLTPAPRSPALRDSEPPSGTPPLPASGFAGGEACGEAAAALGGRLAKEQGATLWGLSTGAADEGQHYARCRPGCAYRSLLLRTRPSLLPPLAYESPPRDSRASGAAPDGVPGPRGSGCSGLSDGRGRLSELVAALGPDPAGEACDEGGPSEPSTEAEGAEPEEEAEAEAAEAALARNPAADGGAEGRALARLRAARAAAEARAEADIAAARAQSPQRRPRTSGASPASASAAASSAPRRCPSWRGDPGEERALREWDPDAWPIEVELPEELHTGEASAEAPVPLEAEEAEEGALALESGGELPRACANACEEDLRCGARGLTGRGELESSPSRAATGRAVPVREEVSCRKELADPPVRALSADAMELGRGPGADAWDEEPSLGGVPRSLELVPQRHSPSARSPPRPPPCVQPRTWPSPYPPWPPTGAEPVVAEGGITEAATCESPLRCPRSRLCHSFYLDVSPPSPAAAGVSPMLPAPALPQASPAERRSWISTWGSGSPRGGPAGDRGEDAGRRASQGTPDFERMPLSELKAHYKRTGLRPGPEAYMRAKLRQIMLDQSIPSSVPALGPGPARAAPRPSPSRTRDQK